MILEQSSIELSALDALQLLDPEEVKQFERESRINPELAECNARFRDLAAGIAVAGCDKFETPPLTVLTGALERIGAVDRKRPRRVFFDSFRPAALAACAALFLLVGGGATVMMLQSGKDAPPDEPVAARKVGEEDRIVVMRNGETVATLTASDRTLTEMLHRLERMERLAPAPDVIQDIARLKRELKSLRRADSARFTAGPRVARTVYIEMVEPGKEAEESQLSDRVREIATSIELEIGAVEAGESEVIEGPDDEKSPVIFEPDENGALPDLNGIDDGTPFYYRDFPVGDDRFERIDDGRVWDAANQKIWIETDDPGLFLAFEPPVHFDPDFIDDYAGAIPLGGIPTAPEAEAAAPVQAEDPVPIQAEEMAVGPVAVSPVAVTIYEETTGRGSVVIGNLPPSGEGQSYQLWMRNSADDQVVSVGLLPELGEGSERFEFDMLGPGITPAGFFLTLEPEGGVDTPGETVVLQGP